MTVRYTQDRCPIMGKITYLSLASAEENAARVNAKFPDHGPLGPVRPHLCHAYPHWHIGHPYKSRRLAALQERQAS